MTEASHRDPTTLHVQRACEGDRPSTAWIVERFSPLLLCYARRRIERHLEGRAEPEDISHEVWLRVLPRLDRLQPAPDGRFTPALIQRLRLEVLEVYCRQMRTLLRSEAATPTDAVLDRELTPVVEAALVRETVTRISDHLQEALEPRDRELLLRRVIDEESYRALSAEWGTLEATLRKRFQRLVDDLRSQFRGSVFDEIVET